MDEIGPTLGEAWNARCSAALRLLRLLVGSRVPVSPEKDLSVEGFVQTMRTVVAAESISKDRVSSGAPSSMPKLGAAPPPIADHARYKLMAVNIRTPTSVSISSAEGGVAFEDPLWAVLVAYGLIEKRGFGLPKAMDNDHLWSSALAAQEAVELSRYKSEDFLGPMTGYVAEEKVARFDVIVVSGSQLSALRSHGMQVLKVAAPPRFFELFEQIEAVPN